MHEMISMTGSSSFQLSWTGHGIDYFEQMSVNLPIGQATESRGAETGTEVCRCKPKTACASRADRGQRQGQADYLIVLFHICPWINIRFFWAVRARRGSHH